MADAILAQSGIYAIRNKSNGKLYVGQSIELSRRLVSHKNSLRRGDHHCQHLQRAYEKEGRDNFEAVVLEQCEPDELTTREQFWMDHFSDIGIYNESPAAGSCRGRVTSEETKVKIVAALTGKKHTDQRRANISASQVGKRLGVKRAPFSDEWRANISAAGVGRVASIEARARISAANIGITRNLGHVMSEEQKRKISKTTTGRKKSDEVKKKIAATLSGRKRPPEVIAKVTASLKLYHEKKKLTA